ncbi:DNA polymerase domain-containing protein [Heliorestis acidaminivorans]|uniref:DNA polymerase domain-containing protein n=1 Tax=Heliorestis acidaminivorans TaxID=553427 RepID=A0A6I0EYB7_9FIRM|nr:non-homologous end-joining DNA ligase [Heliorestis acidaminivorans]KAB2952310.1 DNA polymerase domain-containing protein [Heliorestis acidaminivorans]
MDQRSSPTPSITAQDYRTLEVRNGDQSLRLTNLDKIFWPDEGFTKGDLLDYYLQIAPYLLPHLKDRPIVMVRYPDGIQGKSFYQKESPSFRPEWLTAVAIPSQHRGSPISYCLIRDWMDLLWVINLGTIELHPWLSQIGRLNHPTYMVFDLDPHESQSFSTVVEVALLVKEALDSFGLTSYPKTSGRSGLHIYVPLRPIYDYKTVRDCAIVLAQFIEKVDRRVTLKRSIKERGNSLYLDCWQIGQGKTLASVYSPRPLRGAPVSTPLHWSEVTSKVKPSSFSIKTVSERVSQKGDFFAPTIKEKNSLTHLLEFI